MNENGTSQMQNNTRGEKGAEEKKCGNECMVVFHFHRSTLINKSFHTKVQIQGLNECIHAYMHTCMLSEQWVCYMLECVTQLYNRVRPM